MSVFILLSVQLWRIHPEMKCTSSILDVAYKINVKSWHVSCGTYYLPTFFSFWAGEAWIGRFYVTLSIIEKHEHSTLSMLKLNSMRSTPPFLCIHYALLLILCPTKSCTLWSPEKIIFTDCNYDFLEKISPCTLHVLQISTFIVPHHPFLLNKLTIPQLEQLTPIGWDFHLMSFFLWQTEGKQANRRQTEGKQKMKVTHAQLNQVVLPKLAIHKWRWHILQCRNFEH